MCVIRRHFLACEDIAGGSDMSAGGTFFREIYWLVRWVPAIRGETFFCEIRWPVQWVPAVRWRNNYLRVIRRHFLAAAVDPVVSLSTYSTLPMEVVP